LDRQNALLSALLWIDLPNQPGVLGGTPMWDLFYIAMTVLAFGVLWLILKGVEHFER
jgi:hypothetical protein